MLINIWYKEGGEAAHYRTRGGEWRGRKRLTRIFLYGVDRPKRQQRMAQEVARKLIS